VVTYAKCCYPIPGVPIIGFLSAGRGIVLHQEQCNNVHELRHSPEKCIHVNWEANVEGNYMIELKLDVINEQGLLATIASTFADNSSDISNVTIDERDGRHNTLNFLVAVKNRLHLAKLMRNLRKVSAVIRISRK